MNISRLSILRMIETDYISYMAVLAPVVLAGVYVFGLLTGREVTNTYLYVMAGITLAGIFALIWRYRLFTSVFEDGQQAQATISHISFHRDRGKVEYVYTYMGESYKSSTTIHKISRVMNLQVDEKVIVMIDRNNPKQAFIRDLYLQTQ
jgi:hypothetical protein